MFLTEPHFPWDFKKYTLKNFIVLHHSVPTDVDGHDDNELDSDNLSFFSGKFKFQVQDCDLDFFLEIWQTHRTFWKKNL